MPVDGGAPIWPEPVLVGRSEQKLRALAEQHGLERFTTDLDEALADPPARSTSTPPRTAARAEGMERAIGAGKHVYCEKPSAPDARLARCGLARLAREAGVKHGVVQDKLFLPGLRKLRALIDGGFFGRILSVRGEFGYWVFEGPSRPAQRPSWNYRAEDGGGILADMLPHWRYVLDDLFGRVAGRVHARPPPTSASARTRRATPTTPPPTTPPTRIFELEGGDRRADQLVLVRAGRPRRARRVPGRRHRGQRRGRACASCRIQPRDATPRAIWNPDMPNPIDFRERLARGCRIKPSTTTASRSSGSCSCATSWTATPFAVGPPRGRQAESSSPSSAERSWRERRMLEVPELPA